jgi:hypothetical protein
MKVISTKEKGNDIIVVIRAETHFERQAFNGRGVHVSLNGQPIKSTSGNEITLTYRGYRGRRIYDCLYYGHIDASSLASIAQQALRELSQKMAARDAV